MAAEAEHKPLFMVLDPDGTIIRVVTDETEFDAVRMAHLVSILRRELPRGISDETLARLASDRSSDYIPRCKLIRL